MEELAKTPLNPVRHQSRQIALCFCLLLSAYWLLIGGSVACAQLLPWGTTVTLVKYSQTQVENLRTAGMKFTAGADCRKNRDLLVGLNKSPILTSLWKCPTTGGMKRKNSYSKTSLFESLEGRTLFAAVSLNYGVMNVTGTPNQTNNMAVDLGPDGRLWGVSDNLGSSYLPSQVSSININEGSTSDKYTIGSGITVPVNIIGPDGALVQTIAPAGTSGQTTSTPTNPTSPSTPTDPTTPTSPTQTTTPPPSTTYDPNAPVAAITAVNATSILPGQSVFVNALNSTLNAGTYLTTKYQWDFGDPNSQFDQLTGWNAGHAYENPGTYTITLTITNSLGKTSVATQQVTVSADNRPTIYVDAVNGSDSNNGSSPTSAIKTFAHLGQILQPNEIVLFAKGETYPVFSAVQPKSNDTFDAYGNGSSPVLQWQGALNVSGNSIFLCWGSSLKNVVFQNLTFDTLNPNASLDMPDAIVASGTGITVRDNTFLNVYNCVNANGSPNGLLVADNSQTLEGGMVGYLVWFQGQDGVIVGNTSVNSTRQHNIRCSGGFSKLLIEDNTLQNMDRRDVDPQDYSKSTLDMQYGSFLYINGNDLTDGVFRLGPLSSIDELNTYPTTAKSERQTWTVVEDNVMHNASIDIDAGSQNMVLRNNVLNYDNGTAIYINGYDSTYQRMVQNLSLINNTIINTGTQGNAFYISGQTSSVALDNNLYIAPNLQPGSMASTAPLYIDYGDLSGFSSITNNVWPDPPAAQRNWWANGGINYMLGGANDRSGFYTEAAWDAIKGVSNDVFQTVPLNSGTQLTLPGGGAAGANTLNQG